MDWLCSRSVWGLTAAFVPDLFSLWRPIMEHRKFKQRLAEFVEELTPAQARKLIAAIGERGAGDATQKLIDDRHRSDLKCPHCQGRNIHRHGMARGLQRYKCQSCARTFNALTGTPLARLRKRAEICRRPERLGERPCGCGSGRYQREHLFPLAASLFECAERPSGSAAEGYRRGR